MNTVLWIMQGLLATTFFYSGLMKSTRAEQILVRMGMTGVEHLPFALIRFIGLAELLGAAGLLLPELLQQRPVLTALASLGLGLIMLPAAVIHYRRGELKAVALNRVIFVSSLWIAVGRWPAA